MIISVHGIEGSGKSYLLDKINGNIIKKDTDDFSRLAYSDAYKNNKVNSRYINSRKKYYANKFTEQNKGKFMVLVGMIKIKADKYYYIDIDLDNDYRRYIKREFNKFVDNAAKINRTISQSAVEDIPMNIQLCAGSSNNCILTIVDYAKMYNDDVELHSHCEIKTQKNIIKDINALVKINS